MTGFGWFLGIRGRWDEAITWYEKAAEKGNATAMYNLGLVYRDRGRLRTAERWLRMAAENGDPDADLAIRNLQRRRAKRTRRLMVPIGLAAIAAWRLRRQHR
jgi:hypothetical protein